MVSILVLIWFGVEAFPGQEICVTQCISLVGMNLAEQIAAVVALPILIALGGLSLRRSEKQKQTVGATTTGTSQKPASSGQEEGQHTGSPKS
jgi:hypothetical protein